MKITRIETHLGKQLAIVKVFTDDGAEGVGQTSTYGAGIAVQTLHSMVAPFFVGQNPWDVERLVERTIRKLHKFPGTFLHRALCGIDTAIYDLLGKVTGQPVYRLLGGLERAEVPMYASSMRRETTPEQEIERFQRQIDDHGFRCIKIKIGTMMGRDEDASPGRTEQFIKLARTELGDTIDINADGNGGYTAAKAINVGRMLEHYNYFHFEEPCNWIDQEATQQVTAALDIAVSGGEQDYDILAFRRMIENRVVDIVQPDLGYIGGVVQTRKVAQMADIAGIACTPHCANRTLQMFTLHLAAAMPACFQYHEWSIEEGDSQQWALEVYEEQLEVKDGVVKVPDAPGWGHTVQPSFLKAAELQVSTR